MYKCKSSVDIFAAEILFTKIGSLSKENTVVSPPLEFPYLVICSYLRCHHPTSVRVLLTRRLQQKAGQLYSPLTLSCMASIANANANGTLYLLQPMS